MEDNYIIVELDTRFQTLKETIDKVLTERNYILGKTVKSIHQDVIELTPDKLSVVVKIIPFSPIEEIEISIDLMSKEI